MIRARLKDEYYGEKSERERRNDFFCYLIYRPISFAVTPLLIGAGLSAMTVTLIGFMLAVLMPIAALLSPAHGYLWVAILSFCGYLLDCVDGDVARVTDATSRLGQYLDSLFGQIFQLLFAIAIAIIAANEVPEVALGYWLGLAFMIVLLVIWSRQCRSYYKLSFTTESFAFSADRPFGWKNLLLSSRELMPFVLLILGPLNLAHLILWFLLALALGNFLYVQVWILRQLTR